MFLQMMQVGPLGVNCYLVGDDVHGEVIVIDPGGNAHEIVELLTRLRLGVSAIVLTHGHFDHVMGVTGVKRATDAPLMVGAGEREVYNSVESQAKVFGLAVTPPPVPESWLKEKDIVEA